VLLVGIIRIHEMNFVGFSAGFCRLILTRGSLLTCPASRLKFRASEIRVLVYVPIAYLIASTQRNKKISLKKEEYVRVFRE
jgi:hypothetical protein